MGEFFVKSVKLFGQLLINVSIHIKSKNMYPFLKVYKKEKINNEEKEKIKSDIKSIGIRKICNTINENVKTLLISKIDSISSIGMLSNYTTIIMHINSITSSVHGSLVASIGDLMTENDEENKYNTFKILNFSICLIFGYFAMGILFLSNDFIKVLLGEKYIIDKTITMLLVLSFYLNGRMQIVSIYRNAISLFEKNRYIPLFETILSIIVSILLMNNMGISGILFGAIIGMLLTTFIFEPYNLFKYGFEKEYKKRIDDYIKMLIKDILFLIVLSFAIFKLINFNVSNIAFFVLKGMTYTVFFCVFAFIFYKNDKDMIELYKLYNHVNYCGL